MSRRCLLGLLAIVIAWWPLSAMADAGTPLVWGTVFHLLLGNALLGLLEGWMLARIFGLSTRSCAGWLIAANYLSAWIGLVLANHLFARYATDVYVGLRVTWLLVAGTWVLTLVVEWPFVAACFRGTRRWLAFSLKGSLLVQSASYLGLFGGYWLLSGTSLYTTTQVVQPDQIARPPRIALFFISPTDGHVYRADLDGSEAVKVADLPSASDPHDHLMLQECSADTHYWDLTAVLRSRQNIVVWPRISSRTRIPPEQARRTGQYWGWGHGAFQVGNATNSAWNLRWAHWEDVGMWAQDGTRTVRVAYGIPFGGWAPYRVIHLPDDLALLQLDRQICLVDIPRRQIALIRKGHGVMALHEDQILEPDARGNPSRVIPSGLRHTASDEEAGVRRDEPAAGARP